MEQSLNNRSWPKVWYVYIENQVQLINWFAMKNLPVFGLFSMFFPPGAWIFPAQHFPNPIIRNPPVTPPPVPYFWPPYPVQTTGQLRQKQPQLPELLFFYLTWFRWPRPRWYSHPPLKNPNWKRRSTILLKFQYIWNNFPYSFCWLSPVIFLLANTTLKRI